MPCAFDRVGLAGATFALLLAASCGSRSELSVEGPASDAGSQATSCVLFGGFPSPSSGDSSDTWVWDGAAWTPHPQSVPGSFTGAAVTVSGRIVLVGIPNNTGATSVETWVWSGTAWTQQETPVAPPPRIQGAVAALGSDVVLFGGLALNSNQFLSDTWVWAGPTWTERSPAIAPPGRSRATMGGVNGKILLFGGGNESGSLGDTWAWDGTTWASITSATAPSPRSGAAAAAVGGRVLLFGGCVGGGYQGCTDVGTDAADTWQWAPSGSWTVVEPGTSPPPRNVAAAATFGSKALLFGGFTGPGDNVTLGDTWVWNGTAWASPGVMGPPGRGLAALSCK